MSVDDNNIVGLPNISSPPAGIYRVERATARPFACPDWQFADNGWFDGRFSDPWSCDDAPDEQRFRVIYAATLATGAVVESIVRFRGKPGLASRVNAAVENVDEDDSEENDANRVSAEWRALRLLRHTVLPATMPFVDVSAGSTLTYLREVAAPVLRDVGMNELDLSGITGQSRHLTQFCARHLWELTDDSGEPRFAGIRYLSRLGSEWECWAIFCDRFATTRVCLQTDGSLGRWYGDMNSRTTSSPALRRCSRPSTRRPDGPMA